MKKILLFFPKLEEHKDYHYFPVSLLAAAAPMVANGMDVEIFDERVDENLSDRLKNVSEFMVSLYTGYQFSRGYEITKWVRKHFPHIKITWGGPAISAMDENIFDYKLVDNYVKEDVDDGTYPIPYWLVNIEKYVNPSTERFIYLTSYNCIGSCSFCQTKKRRKLKFLPLERVENDINYLMEHYPYEEVVFFDATIFTKPSRALFIADLMRKHGLKWICDSRADEICRTSREMLDSIVNSGLTQITIGLETGSQRVADAMKKGKNHLEKYRQCAEIMSKYDIKMCSGVIFGTPGETPEDIKQTIEYIKEIKAINPNFYVSTTFFMPLPGTEMAEACKAYGYKEPETLQGWAELGSNTHYSYNEYHSSMWIQEPEEYKRIYDNFVAENGDLFI